MMAEINKVLVVDSRMSVTSKRTLICLGYVLIEIPECLRFEHPICAHPDLHVLKFSDKLHVFSFVKEMFTNFRFIEVGREQEPEKSVEILKYPDNVFLNCAVVGKNLICNKKFTSETVLQNALIDGYNIIQVKQGYAKCSTCVVCDNAIITEDDGIASSCEKAGIDVLKITKGYVKLEGYDYGFIGGASGLIEKDVLAINGNINLHPDGKRMIEFCEKHGVNVKSLNNEPLYDVGSIIRIQ